MIGDVSTSRACIRPIRVVFMGTFVLVCLCSRTVLGPCVCMRVCCIFRQKSTMSLAGTGKETRGRNGGPAYCEFRPVTRVCFRRTRAVTKCVIATLSRLTEIRTRSGRVPAAGFPRSSKKTRAFHVVLPSSPQRVNGLFD